MSVMNLFVPGFSDSVIDYKLFTPKNIEDDINMPSGNTQHGELTLDQLFFMRPGSRICGLSLARRIALPAWCVDPPGRCGVSRARAQRRA